VYISVCIIPCSSAWSPLRSGFISGAAVTPTCVRLQGSLKVRSLLIFYLCHYSPYLGFFLLCIEVSWSHTATVEWYWQEGTEELWEKPVPVPLCPPKIPLGLTRARTRAYALRGRRLTTWTMTRHHYSPYLRLVLLCIEVSWSRAFRHTVGLLWTSDQPVAETFTYTGQHNI
jgi:hypothetical protein